MNKKSGIIFILIGFSLSLGLMYISSNPKAEETSVNTIVSIKKVSSGIEIELHSTKSFPIRALPPILRIGAKGFMMSRYPTPRDLYTLAFYLTLPEFDQLNTSDPVIVHYGGVDLESEYWDFGVLDKNMLINN